MSILPGQNTFRYLLTISSQKPVSDSWNVLKQIICHNSLPYSSAFAALASHPRHTCWLGDGDVSGRGLKLLWCFFIIHSECSDKWNIIRQVPAGSRHQTPAHSTADWKLMFIRPSIPEPLLYHWMTVVCPLTIFLLLFLTGRLFTDSCWAHFGENIHCVLGGVV